MLLAELFVVRQNSLGFMVLAGEHGDVRFKRIALRLQLLVFPPESLHDVSHLADFRFKLFGFSHKPIILLEKILFNARGLKLLKVRDPLERDASATQRALGRPAVWSPGGG